MKNGIFKEFKYKFLEIVRKTYLPQITPRKTPNKVCSEGSKATCLVSDLIPKKRHLKVI